VVGNELKMKFESNDESVRRSSLAITNGKQRQSVVGWDDGSKKRT
jgi:hypothetical protein